MLSLKIQRRGCKVDLQEGRIEDLLQFASPRPCAAVVSSLAGLDSDSVPNIFRNQDFTIDHKRPVQYPGPRSGV